jgi:hypothetical protein
MNEQFAPVRARLAAIPQRLEETRRNASIYVESPLDFESLILTAFTSRFSAMGFPVANSRNAAAAVCQVTVDEGMQQRELGIFYFPKLQAVISGPSGVLFTFSAEGSQASAVTPDVAKRRAYQSLADEVNKNFTININAL